MRRQAILLFTGAIRISGFVSRLQQHRVALPIHRVSVNQRLFSSIPEPGPCPDCTDENTYWDGSTLFVCTNCQHEWPIAAAGSEEEDTMSVEDAFTDVNGNVLQAGDTCVLTQDLAKGKLKKGLKVKIRLGDYGDGHDCEATISGVGTYALKTKFLKKVS
jgi:protein PhnA